MDTILSKNIFNFKDSERIRKEAHKNLDVLDYDLKKKNGTKKDNR